MEAIVILLMLAVFCFAMALVLVRAKWREAKKDDEIRQQYQSKVNRVEINCDDDGTVTVITDEPEKVRVVRRS